MQVATLFLKYFVVGMAYTAPLWIPLLTAIVLTGLAIGRREGWDRLDSLYYALITATTVGYGDFHPVSRSSKWLAIGIAVTGLILTGMVVGLAVHAATMALKTL